jgi:hypothetical protein
MASFLMSYAVIASVAYVTYSLIPKSWLEPKRPSFADHEERRQAALDREAVCRGERLPRLVRTPSAKV